MSMGLAIVGYGKMGRLIEQLAPEYGFEVRAKFDARSNARGQALSDHTLQGVDVAVEFTSPDAAPENIRRLAAMGVNSVSGTTGWFGDLPSVREAVAKSGTGLVWAPNFSVGVNLFMQAVAHTAALFAKHADYEAWGWEIHHSAKKDAPSGTLKKLAEEMAHIPARMKLVLIRLPTPSPCGIRRAAGMALRAGHCARRDGSTGSKAYSNFARFSAN